MQDRCKGEPETQKNTVSTLSCLSDRPGILSDIDLVPNEKRCKIIQHVKKLYSHVSRGTMRNRKKKNGQFL